ncbi:hypothetical protein K7472_14950 [Streptomyces sp. PTM05]|uniref:Uncharacterized protein n=1 Tax=Streptantibioticus parmotrematis TaxID=2873249 RepID=A0ABS7QSH5_9ACTN|nr:hypothetical protein [Streptantibioticus parmotrematis]MBY8886148.1 hypothetical protein [Streptantibioticus parmotrematis]
MGKNKNQNPNRSRENNAPARGTAPDASTPHESATATMDPERKSPMSSGMNQEMSHKRKKKFGHN